MGETGSRGLTLARGGGSWLLGDYNLRVVLQLVKAAVGYNIPGIDAFNGGLACIRDAGLDISDLGGIVLNDVDECGLAIMLNRRSRNQSDALQGVDQQPGVYELVRK